MDPATGTVVLRWTTLGRTGPTGPLEAVLSDAERARADRFRVADARLRHVTGRACLRQTLARLLGVAPAAVPLTTTEHGKPVLSAAADTSPAFNLSHSGDVVVVAVASCDRLGVDVEVAAGHRDCDRLARRFFTAAEAAAVTAAPDPEPVFLRLWTAKEAWMKAVGEGLGVAPRDVEVTPDPTVAPRLLALPDGHDPADWTLLRVPLPVAAVCTVAIPTGRWRVEAREWRP